MLAGICEVYPGPWLLSYRHNSINDYTPQFFPQLQEDVVCSVHLILCFVSKLRKDLLLEMVKPLQCRHFCLPDYLVSGPYSFRLHPNGGVSVLEASINREPTTLESSPCFRAIMQFIYKK